MAPQKYKMRCHYDVPRRLRRRVKEGVPPPRFEWHPDKNQHRLEEAEGRFKEVRAAYETLSDPNERAWYDSHREAILRSGVHAAGGEDARPEDELNLMPFFTSAAFRGFGDEPGSFYAVYGDLFGQIDAHEQAASLAAGKDSFTNAPPFGASDAPWETVRKFYAHWGLATLKTFGGRTSTPRRKTASSPPDGGGEQKLRQQRRGNTTTPCDSSSSSASAISAAKHQAEQAKLEKAKAAAAARKREAAKKAAAADEEAGGPADGGPRDAGRAEAAEAQRRRRRRSKTYFARCKKRFKSQKQWENHEQSKQHKAAVRSRRR